MFASFWRSFDFNKIFVFQEEIFLATEARLVVQTIAEQRVNGRETRSASVDMLRSDGDVDRSRSNSVEILKEHEMRSIDIDVGSIASRENLLDIQVWLEHVFSLDLIFLTRKYWNINI